MINKNKLILSLYLFLLVPQFANADTSEWTNLLSKVEPDSHAIDGQWKQVEDGLLVNAEKNARLSLGKGPQGDYDAQISFTRKTGIHSITFIFTINGKQAGIELDAWGEHLAGIQMVDNLSVKQNKTRANNVRLENGRQYTLDIKVRGNVVTASLDGQSITQLDTSEHQLSVLNLWQLPDKNALGIGAYDSETVFHSVKLRSINTNDNRAENKTNKKVPVAIDESKKEEKTNDELSVLSDEFKETNDLKNWKRVYKDEGGSADQLESISIEQEKLVLIPYTSSWYQDYRGVLVYKPITGDFIVTTRIRATGRNGKTPPSKQYSLAGIMVRTPRNVSPETWQSGMENYIFLSLGSANQPGSAQFEVKTTVNSDSKLEISQAQSSEAEIRVIRVGSSFILMKREVGGTWNVHRRYHRNDMPKTLQVGMTVYTDWQNVERVPVREHNQKVIKNGNPDLRAEFDYFRFRRPEIPENMKNINFSNPADISNSELLKLFND